MSVIILKPDEIGDFVIATGAIRLLAHRHGEEETTLVVKSELAPLAGFNHPQFTVAKLIARFLGWMGAASSRPRLGGTLTAGDNRS